MKLVLMLVAMAVLAWIIATQLKTAKVVAGDGAPAGTPAQIEQRAKDDVTRAMQQEQKQAEDRLAKTQAAAQ